MTPQRPRLTLDAPAGAWGAPWPQAFEVARALPPGSWTLVGGLMVQLHARIAGLPLTRPTTDVDATLHLETGVIDYPSAAAALIGIGYDFDEEPRLAYRFRRGDDVVDLMAADHLAPAHAPRYRGRDVFAVDGGTQALKRTLDVEIDTGDDTIVLSLPNLHGALVLKGAALLADTRDRGRHASDAVALLACLTDPADVLGHLAGSDARRLRAIARALEDGQPWADAPRDVEGLARPMLADIAAGLP